MTIPNLNEFACAKCKQRFATAEQLKLHNGATHNPGKLPDDWLGNFVREVRTSEREHCAKIAEIWLNVMLKNSDIYNKLSIEVVSEIIAAIRKTA